jgi:hypothetical protein
MADAASAPSYTTPQIFQTRNKLFSWTLTGVSTGVPVKASDFSDKTVQAFGTWGGATLVWEGSNDMRADPAHASYASSVWGTLTDTNETDLSQTANSARPDQVLQNPVWIRPKTTGGTGTSITANMNAGRAS